MSYYKKAVDRIRQHPGFLAREVLNHEYLNSASPNLMVRLMLDKGCLITARHDLNPKYGGRDFLVNLITETVVVHIHAHGGYTVHHWEKLTACSEANRLSRDKEAFYLKELFDLEKVRFA